ncbi:protein kinase/lanthionine synthetase C family protein [Propioniciclava coleopterorum]|uniref:Protein kinase/lanthionine synthetase C family protein n=1 Tax=Propioniciclava coleopterorum TaxID=2714937 RepID=A0A6G7Y612_9ACTN|nr:class III lanthionine synthetase LanKC [Propioniciclava coleopterorum]QIK72334.1 protein kinase/lanthionine synthetase C family protein [Propioniciclava coleopterorum]
MGVRPEYFMATHPDSPFYGAPQRLDEMMGAGERLQAADLPAGWLRQTFGVWEGWTPRDWRPRLQGWKIHVSASLAHATTTLERVTSICVEREVAFKFLPNEAMLADTNGKQADRGSSGKFVTIYPGDDTQFAELLIALEDALAGQDGPYILSDLRYGDAPVYVRYGGIMALHYPDERDQPVAALAGGDTLTLVPDERQPKFTVPAGVELPACLVAPYERSRQGTPSRLREFKAVSALHFSNAGGVYLATLPDGTRRVLREARPHTGIDGRGRDALTRQLEEERVLTDLSDLPGVQHLVGSFTAWEHRYLELDYVVGRTLTSWVVQNSPYDSRDGGAKRAEYGRRCRRIVGRLVDTVAAIHARGWCIGDVHPGNIMVTDDDDVVILDLEDASRLDAERTVGFRVFEFCAPEEFTAEQADWYAVSRSIMLLYEADWELEVVAPAFWAEAVRRLEAEYGAEARAQLDAVTARFPTLEHHLLSPRETVGLYATPPTADEAIPALDAGVAWSRAFSARNSYPGDPTQARDVSESLGFGRAGVVWSRLRTDAAQHSDDLDLLEAAARDWSPEEIPGLYDGLAGLALTLADAGRPSAAVAAARRALQGAEARRRLDLYGGQVGVLLAGIEVAAATGDEELRRDALAGHERLHRAVARAGGHLDALTHRRGLHFGLAGLALLDLSAHLATGEARLLDRAIDRLADEVGACFVTADGEMMVRDVDNNRALPYIEWGSAGVWAVVQLAERLARQRLLDDEQRDAFARSCSADFYVYPGLDHGRCGTAVVLSGAGPRYAAEVQRQRDLVLATLLKRLDMAFVAGDGYLRLSSDLATGAAGVRLGLHCLAAGRPFDWLPLGRGTADRIAALPLPDAAGVPVPDRPAALIPGVVGHG